MRSEEITKIVDFVYDTFPEAARPTKGIYSIWMRQFSVYRYQDVMDAAQRACAALDRPPRPGKLMEYLQRSSSDSVSMTPQQFKELLDRELAKDRVIVATQHPENDKLYSFMFKDARRCARTGERIKIKGLPVDNHILVR